MGNTAACPSDMCGANKEFDNFNIPQHPGMTTAQSQHEARKVQTFHRYAEEGDVKVRVPWFGRRWQVDLRQPAAGSHDAVPSSEEQRALHRQSRR